MTENVRIERSGAVATVILDRPAVRNAVDPATAAALAEAFLACEHDDAIHATVLWGAGGTFCAGADLQAVARSWDAGRLREPSGDPADPCGPMGPTRLRLDKPVVAAVAGHAVAGGLELALWCDLRVVEEDAAFPQGCLRADRRSVYGSVGLDEAAALAAEYSGGLAVLRSGESAAGAARFVSGAGRSGRPA